MGIKRSIIAAVLLLSLLILPGCAISEDLFESETAALESLSAAPNYRLLHDFRGHNDLIDVNGAAGRNTSGFSDVAAQRDALWVLRRGIIYQDEVMIDRAVKAMEYGFDHQNAQGYFENALGASPLLAVEADAFFMQAYARMYLLLQNSVQFSGYTARLDALRPQSANAMLWLKQNTAELYRQERDAPNRLVFTGIAFLLNGQLLNEPNLIDIGYQFIDEALDMQHPDGYFLEKGGYDSSYQAVSLLNLMIVRYYTENEPMRVKLYDAVALGMAWEKTRIEADGNILVEGNTRTGLGQEEFLGSIKGVNYPEVALSVYYWSRLTGSEGDVILAETIVNNLRVKLGG